jgi:hypothetical protein
MNKQSKPQANRFVKGLSVFVGLNGLYIVSWPFIGLFLMLLSDTRVFMGPIEMILCIIIGALMVKTPFQVFRDYSKTALAGVVLGLVISFALDGVMVLGIVAQTFNV